MRGIFLMSDIYRQYLATFEFSDEEIEENLTFWKKVCHLLNFSKKDVRYSLEQWIPQYWDISLRGVRMCIGAYIRELIQFSRLAEFKERGDKIIYCNLPVHPVAVYANKVAGGERIHISQPDFLLISVLQVLFGKTELMKGKDFSCLNKNGQHCGKNRMRINAQCEGIIAAPTVEWNWGMLCNEGPKTDEYMKCLDMESEGHSVVTIMPHDVNMGVREAEDDRRVSYLSERIAYAQKEISHYTGITINQKHILQADELYQEYVSKLEEMNRLIYEADPQPVSCNEFTLFSSIQHTPFDTGWKYFLEAITIFIEEIEERIQKKAGRLPAGSPKFACFFTPYCVPWVGQIFENQGVNIAYDMYFATSSIQKQCENDEDIYRIMAKQWLSHPVSVNTGDEANILIRILQDKPVDGVLYGFFTFDCWIEGMHKTMLQIVEEKTGIPQYYLEGNFWNDASFTKEDRLSRIQNISYHTRIRQMVRTDYGKK